MNELLSLKWNNHCSTFLQILSNVRNKQKYTDVTLACAGKFYSAHRIVLSSCSDYFQEIFDTTDSKNLVILLKDIKSWELEAILDYMYTGEVNVKQTDLSSLIKVAECLQIKGLAEAEKKPEEETNKSIINSSRPKRKRKLDDHYSSSISPPAKVKVTQASIDNVSRQPIRVDEEINEVDEEINEVDEEINEVDDVKNIVIEEEDIELLQPEVFSIDDDECLQEIIAGKPKTENITSASANSSLDMDSNLTLGNASYSAEDTHGTSNNDNSNPWKEKDFDVCSTPVNANIPPDESLMVNRQSGLQCKVCFKMFRYPSHFNAHMRVHTGERPYACEQCHYRTRQKCHLNTHILMRHGADLDHRSQRATC